MASDADKERYRRAVNRLLSLADFERKSRADQPPDWHLKRVMVLMEMLGSPHLAVPVVHVAGSKGKGSTCAMIATALNSVGIRAGLYTSPHLHSFVERIQVNGENIAHNTFADLIEDLWPHVEAIERLRNIGGVSVFEMLTAMAFVHFRDNADVAVIETGLGGRLDATNVIDPLVAVITSISRDHTRILGDKISQIAEEKAGIIKPGRPVVVARNHSVTWRVIREQAAQVVAPVVSACASAPVATPTAPADDPWRITIRRWRRPKQLEIATSGSILRPYPSPVQSDVEVRSPLAGTHQIDNIRTAAATLNILYRSGIEFNLNAAIQGISNTKWPCRFEVVAAGTRMPFVLDGAHNDASMRALARTLYSRSTTIRSDDSHEPFRTGPLAKHGLILGATAGHDYREAIRLFGQNTTRAIAVSTRHPKSVPAVEVAEIAHRMGFNFEVASSVEHAVEMIQGNGSGPTQFALVTGSLFVAAEAREALLGIEPELYEDLPQPYMTPYSEAR